MGSEMCIRDRATISRFDAVADTWKFQFSGFLAWVLWLAVHIMYQVGFKNRFSTVFHWAVSFLGRGRSQRTATQQQVYGRLALEELGSDFEVSKTGGRHHYGEKVDVTGRESA